MISSSPITPPPEQFTTCRYDWSKADTEAMEGDPAFRCILELRTARRPKPPSDKELALNALSLIMSQQKGMFDGKPFNTIRLALEALPND